MNALLTLLMIYQCFGIVQDFEGPKMEELCEKLKQMSTDNNKHQAKKDRKQQRGSFRDILHYIEVCC